MGVALGALELKVTPTTTAGKVTKALLMNFHKWWDSLREPFRFTLFIISLGLIIILINCGGWGRPSGLLIMFALFVWRIMYLTRS